MQNKPFLYKIVDKSRVPFIVQSFEGLKECASCKYGKICRGGCRRDRQTASGLDKNYFCSSYKRFFEHALPKMIKLLSDR
ncbi:MAG: SPASM domain-containing protein [Clostridia bacterium]|nr:SPASM domain-containing protein [Clostridia bacterium]